VLELIRENNLFTDVQDQVLLLVEFDQELNDKRKEEGVNTAETSSEAISMLVDHTHSISVCPPCTHESTDSETVLLQVDRVVQQLRARPLYLFFYLDALFKKDQNLASDFADIQVKLFAEYATSRLIEYLRASNYYNLEAVRILLGHFLGFNPFPSRRIVSAEVVILFRRWSFFSVGWATISKH